MTYAVLAPAMVAGEHGDGAVRLERVREARAETLEEARSRPEQRSPERLRKPALDPQGLLNPGVLFEV